MNKRFIDVVLIPAIITVICGFAFMVWGAWYTGVKLHSPFSWHWIRTVLAAPVPLWSVLLIIGGASVLGWISHLSRRNYKELTEQMLKTNKRLEAEGREHDESIFRQADAILDETKLTVILDMLQTDDSYFLRQVRNIDEFVRFFSQTSNQFIDWQLLESKYTLTECLDRLTAFLAANFFVYPEKQSYKDDMRLCMYPDLNIDRSGTGTQESMEKYHHFQVELDALAKATRSAYSVYRLAVKHHLYV